MNLNRIFDTKRRGPRVRARCFEHEKSPALKLCPKCGGKAYEHRSDCRYWVSCDVKNCRHSTRKYATREEAVEAWNRG